VHGFLDIQVVNTDIELVAESQKEFLVNSKFG